VQRLLGRLSGYFPAVLAGALPIVFIPNESDNYILPRASLVIGGACIGIGLALVAPGDSRLGALRWPLLAAATAAVLAFAFSVSWPLSLAGSYTRYESLPMRLGYLGLLAAAVWLAREQRHRDWVVAAFVFGTCVASLEGVQQWNANVAFRPDGNLGNANLLAALVAMAVPLAVSRALRGGPFVLAWGAAVPVLVAGLLVTTSRSGGFGVIAGCLTLAVFASRGRLALGSAVASIAIVGAGLFVLLGSQLRALNNDPPELRLHLWADGLRMIAARPLTGWGEDATGLSFGHFLSQDYASLVTFDRVHSGPLDIAATQGILGLAALAWVLVVLFGGAWRQRFDRDVAALGAALVGYTVWVVFNFDWAPVTGPFWLLAGTLWASLPRLPGKVQPREAPGRMGSRIWRPGLAVLLVLAATTLAALPVVADIWSAKGRADLSVRLDPLQADYHWAIGTVEEMRTAADLGEPEPDLYVQLGDREAQLGNRAEARRDYERALEIDPYFSPASQRLAALGP